MSRLGEGGLCPACLLAACLESEVEGGEEGDSGSNADAAWLEKHGLDGSGAEPSARRRFGDYESFEELGRGAMGVVYRARQLSLGRWVAVKFLLAGPLASLEAIQRFQVEATAAAALQHPGIVAIHEVGVHEGQHYLVMDYIEGRSLAQVISDFGFGVSDLQRCAGWVKAIAEAVDYAHEHGVLHRDLKPSNVLIDEADQPHVTDFGLAKRLGTESSLTLSGQVVGSPSYLPPEQAGGRRGQVGRASDVYSLGAMLFHLLTGRPPFVGESPVEVIHQVLEEDPASPRLIRPGVPRDLETICLKCLEKEPARRYATAQELAEELGRFLNCEPIQARPVGRVGRLARWCRRNPAQAALAGSLVMAVILGLAGVLWQWDRARATAVREARERERAEQTVHRLRIGTAEDDFRRGNGAAGLAVLAALLREEPTDRAVAEWLLAELTHRNWPLPVVPPLSHAEPVHYAEVSPDGGRVLTAALDNTVRIWDAATGQPIGRSLEHDRGSEFQREFFTGGQKCLDARFSPDGEKVATASVDKTARVWDGRTGEPLTNPLPHPDWVVCVRWSPDGRWLATTCRDGGVRRWDVATGQPIEPVLWHSDWAIFVEFDADGGRLLTGSEDGTAQVWDAAAGLPVGKRLSHQGWVRAGQFGPDGRRVATASADGTARVWDAATGEPVTPPLHHEGAVSCVQFSPEGNWLATASFDQTVRLWDARTGAALSRPLEHGGSVRSIQFSSEGRRLLTASEDKLVRIWDYRRGKLAMEPIRHNAQVWSARFSPEGTRVVTASSDSTCGVWDVRPGAALPVELLTLRAVRTVHWSPDGRHVLARNSMPGLFVRSNGWSSIGELWSDREVSCVGFSPNGRWVATGSTDGGARIWSTERFGVVLRVRHVGHVCSVCFSRDGQRLLTASSDRLAAVWSTESGRQLLSLAHPVEVRSAEFSPDSSRVLTLGADEWVRVWDAGTGQPIVSWKPHGGEATGAGFSPDGSLVVTCSADGTARVWEAVTGHPVSGSLAHRGKVLAASFSSDQRRVVTASQDNTAVIWEDPMGVGRSRVLRHEAAVYAARFSADGRRVVTASQDRTARVWDAGTGQPLGSALWHGSAVRDAAFSSDGRWLATASERSAWIWPVPQVTSEVPDWLPELAEAVGGLREGEASLSEAVSPAALIEVRRRQSGRGLGGGAGEWLEWFFSDRRRRAAGPGADWTVEEVRVREEAEANWGRVSGARLVEQLVGIEPTNGRLLAQAARVALEEYVRRQDSRVLQEAGWLSRRAVELAPGHAAVRWVYASWLQDAGDIEGTLQAMEQTERLSGVSSRLLLGKAQRYEAEWRENRMEADRVLAAYQAAIEGHEGSAQLGRDELRLAWLACARIHAQAGNREAMRMARRQAYGLDVPPRDPQMPARLVDLSDYYTAGFDTDWRESRFAGHDLSGLPRGRQVMAGVEYDVRGLVQLSSELLEVRRLHFPRAVEGIPVGQRCARLHFLHAADAVVDLGETVARYTIHLGNGGEETVAIRYAEEAWPWDWEPLCDRAQAAAVWRGSSRVGLPVWLYRTTWTNAEPDVPVVSVDLTSAMAWCGMFVVAITAE